MADQNLDKNSDNYRKKVQSRVLSMMKQKLDQKEMDADKAQKLSQYVLEKVHKGMGEEQIYHNIKHFDIKSFPELLEVSVLFIKEHVDRLRYTLADKALKFLHIGQYQTANQIVNKAGE